MVTGNNNLFVAVFLRHVFNLRQVFFAVRYIAIVLIAGRLIISMQPPLGINYYPKQPIVYFNFHRSRASSVREKSISSVQVFLHIFFLPLYVLIAFWFSFFPIVVAGNKNYFAVKILQDIHLSLDGALIIFAVYALFFMESRRVNVIAQKYNGSVFLI